MSAIMPALAMLRSALVRPVLSEPVLPARPAPAVYYALRVIAVLTPNAGQAAVVLRLQQFLICPTPKPLVQKLLFLQPLPAIP